MLAVGAAAEVEEMDDVGVVVEVEESGWDAVVCAVASLP